MRVNPELPSMSAGAGNALSNMILSWIMNIVLILLKWC